ncbi:cupin-like domain-containing protein [Paraburkholderia caledonica]|uniref:JmjC domain-containing protein n=1 Tax=Paraburkholderia caledonica TaxID=134536 RepID=A0AB73IHY5_9BURK|nr:hypothetical protein [Paraburkholderia caledonica]
MPDSAERHFFVQPSDLLVAPDRATFERRYVEPGIPVLIRGATQDWPAHTCWQEASLAARYGDTLVPVSRKGGRDPCRMTFAAYLVYMRDTADPDPLYLANWPFERDCPTLVDDYRNPPIFTRLEEQFPSHLRQSWRWIFAGPAGSGTALHADRFGTSAWNAVITGRKRWRFFSPDQVRLLYGGQVDSFAPDLVAYPLFARACAIECVQEPGDLVFTPSGWWHQVLNERGGISVTENFINHANLENVKRAARLAKLSHFEKALAALG